MSLDNLVADIKRFYKSSLQEIENLFVDESDYQGIIFWYNDLKAYIKETEKASKI